MAVGLPYAYAYPMASAFGDGSLRLATFNPAATAPRHFFSGRLCRPRRTADLLGALMSVVRSRFHVPAAMLGRILAQSDPVVTCSEERLRFEGFSSCAGVYVRVDLLPGALDGRRAGRGTTNVDFNQPMLSALAKVRDRDRVTLEVGADQVKLSRETESVVERKVTLPLRWLKGFVEVQQCQSRMTPVHQISGQEAWRFLRSLPRMKTHRRETFVVASGRGLRLSQVAARDAVRVGGLERLRALEGLSSSATGLKIYSDETTGASAWELSFDDCRFHLVMSPEVWRGFSGEGQALEAIASNQWKSLLPAVRKQLAWQAVIDEEALHRALARKEPISADQVRAALAALGTQGLAGFDLAEGAWFHRELPFDLDSVDKLHPRLRDARKLLAEGKVHAGKRSAAQTVVLVESSDVEHRVRLTEDDARCTCPWYAKHGSSRGPCKHILAAQIFLEDSSGDADVE